MSQQTNDKSRLETSKNHLTALILPVLGVCWLVFFLFPNYLGQESTVEYTAMMLGVGLMVAGVFRFLCSSGDSSESEDVTDPGSRSDSDEL